MTSATVARPRRPRGPAPLPENILWTSALSKWVAWFKTSRPSDKTVYQRHYHVARLSRDFPGRGPWELTTDDLADWMSRHNWGRSTMRSYRSSLRSFYGWAHEGGLITRNPAGLLRAVKDPDPVPRPASEAVVNAALTANLGTPIWLMIMLGSRSAMRSCEICAAHSDDLELDDDGWYLVVKGKGERVRRIPLLPEVVDYIIAQPPGWFFPSVAAPDGHYIAKTVSKKLSKALVDATGHQLRHRAGTKFYRFTGGDIVETQKFLGHADIRTTQRYVLPLNGVMRRGVEGIR